MDNTTSNPGPAPMPTPVAPTPGTEAPKKKSNAGVIIAIVLAVIFVVIVLPCIFIGMIVFGVFRVVDSAGPEIINQIEKEIERTESENYVAGTWNCASGTGSENDRDNFKTTIELNADMTFRYGPYGDLDKNHFSGTYTVEDEDKSTPDGSYDYYMIKFDSKEFMENGVINTESDSKLSEMEMGITKTDKGKQAITIFTFSYNMYYCYNE